MNRGCAANACCTNSCTAGLTRSCCRVSVDAGSGTASDGTRQATSPRMPMGSRLVVRTLRPGHALSRSSTSWAQASSRCSQLSSTSSKWRSRSAFASAVVSGSSAFSRTSSAMATRCGTSDGSASGPNSTSHTPSELSSTTVRATSSASRVLPQPPTPVSVSRRVPASLRLISTVASSRPTRLVVGDGRLCRTAPSDALPRGAEVCRRTGATAA
jgi:hypothetical protein